VVGSTATNTPAHIFKSGPFQKQPADKGKIIMGIDPGFRTGCKVAVIDETGKYLEGETIYPHEPQKDALGSKRVLKQFIRKYEVSVIAIGNGTASRETESLVADLIADLKKEDSHLELVYTIVSEAGASVYSASKIAQQEFPDLEASQRGNISIARRLLDPLAELVKIDPKSIGVGQYQHDVNQKRLAEQLTHVVESAVNYVGVNLNTASAALLTYVSGLSSKTAQSIIAHRDKNGKFSRREQLMDVTGIGPAAYQQCAGFLRIPDGDNPLDNTSIHPESYDATQKLLKKFNIVDPSTAGSLLELQLRNAKMSFENIAGEVGVGVPTLKDILDNLKKPGRDPREEMPKPIFKSDVLKMEDLREGMMLKGTVRNVVDFGAFVDIGVKQDGLVHISHLSNKYVKNPMEVVAVGDVVDVKVMSVDLKKGRVQLSMKEASRSY
ncbi:MAG TPA: helix-hairpin-helix domain-containing protein, partial [bacterium]|nr:helix-hairpin-helix domain-containing protein [bacterium]